MWTTLALAVAMASGFGQTQSLTISNVRAIRGLFGPERQDNKVLPGDVYLLVFDIEGLTLDANNDAPYRMAMEVTDAHGKLRYGSATPDNRKAKSSLGGSKVPASAFVEVGLDQEPGELTLKVTVTDPANNASQKFSRKFEVLPRDFGLVRLNTSIDPDGRAPVPASGEVGEIRWINAGVVGFERDTARKQPNLHTELKVLDENGKDVGAKPQTEDLTEPILEKASLVPRQFMLWLNRPGKFTVELECTDRISKKTARLSIPLTVTEPKGSAARE